MKLAEALILRADYKRRLEQLKQRLLLNAKVQQGDRPAEQPADLLRQVDELSNLLTRLVQNINLTNASVRLGDEGTIADAIASRDALRAKHALFREIANAASSGASRVTRSEIKFVSTIDVARIQSDADRLAQQQRELDARIQEVNWLTELVER